MCELDRFKRFWAEILELRLEPFQIEIAKEVFSKRREALILLPRGNGKSTLLAAIGLWHLLSHEDPQVAVGAASREQAAVLFDIARGMASHPAIAARVELTRREIRTTNGYLKIVSSDGPQQHGLILSLAVIDELHAHRDAELYTALRTGMLKRRDARMVTISTAGAGTDSALGELRDRALEQSKVRRKGSVTRAVGPNLALLEWSLPETASIDDMALVRPPTRRAGSMRPTSPSGATPSTRWPIAATTATSGSRPTTARSLLASGRHAQVLVVRSLRVPKASSSASTSDGDGTRPQLSRSGAPTKTRSAFTPRRSSSRLKTGAHSPSRRCRPRRRRDPGRAWLGPGRGAIELKSHAGRRRVPISAMLRDYLAEHLARVGRAEAELIFGNTPNAPFTGNMLQRRADLAWKPCGLERITPHECRHTFASLMIAAGVNAKALSTFMGHAKIAITLDRYGHMMPGSEAEAAGLLDAYLDAQRERAEDAARGAGGMLTGAPTGAHLADEN